jgi:hypothetical protein
MSKTIETPEPTQVKPTKINAALKSRFIACCQSAGRIGKSTFNETLITFYRRHSIPFAGFDADGEHRTLVRRYPNDVAAFDAAHSAEEFNRMAEAITTEFPVTLADFPAQANRFILDSFERLSLLDLFEAKGIRPTLLIFASDDPTALASASATKAYGDERADYLLIKNPARFLSVNFFKTPMAGWFAERNSPVIIMPEAQPSTMSAWSALEKALKQSLPLDEACSHPGLSEIKQAELQYLRDRVIAQLEEHAGHVLPDASVIGSSHKVAAKAKRAVIDPFDDPNY